MKRVKKHIIKTCFHQTLTSHRKIRESHRYMALKIKQMVVQTKEITRQEMKVVGIAEHLGQTLEGLVGRP